MRCSGASTETRVNSQVDNDLAKLWESLRSTGDAQAREELILRYASFARTIAATLYRCRPDSATPFEDYLQYARVGLMEAVDRYDGSRGASFETFSGYRIRGAILNGLARDTELGAQRSFWRTRLADREKSLAPVAVEHPESATLEELVRLVTGLAIGFVLEGPAPDPVDETPESNPYLATELEEIRAHLRTRIGELPDREREIVREHYFEHREFQEIAARLGVTKGRVSQLHARAVARIRELMDPRPRIDRKL